MKTHWETAVGARHAKVAITEAEVMVASNCGPNGSDVGAVFSHPEFLEGRYHEVIVKLFGQGVLDEMIASVRNVAAA